MIDFSNVRIEKEKTYTFITNVNTRKFEWAFEDAGITDYQIESLQKIKDQLPAHVVIPDTVLLVPSDPVGRKCNHPCVLISHMNVNDLTEKLIEIHYTDDADIKRREDAIQKRAGEIYEKCYAPYITNDKHPAEV